MNKRQFSLSMLHRLRVHKLIGKPSLARGVVFVAHRVEPARDTPFQPNRLLTITPEFLEAVIVRVRRLGFDIISLDEAHALLLDEPDWASRKPFACFTFDDGYRNNRDWAFPVLEKHEVAHTIYVPTTFIDGRGVLWWELFERILAGNDAITLDDGAVLAASTTVEKYRAFDHLVRCFSDMAPPDAHDFAVRLAKRYGIDSDAVCRELIMGWDELGEYARQDLLTIGGHTVHHYRLAKLSEEAVAWEIETNISELERRLGYRPRHFSYPFGATGSVSEREYKVAGELGLGTAVTTINGNIEREQAERLTALPRQSLNRVYDDVGCLEVLISGVPRAFSRSLGMRGGE